MKQATLNPAQQAELERLLAEQEADDTGYVSQSHRSLDAPLGDDPDSASLHELVEERPVEVGPARSKVQWSYKVTAEQEREWRLLRKDGWTYQRIADYAGVTYQTVRHHISKGTGERRGSPHFLLVQRIEEFGAAYDAGASVRQIAELHYEELGYASWESCYQQVRVELLRLGVDMRWRTMKHGMRSVNAPVEARRRFNRERERQRNRARLTRCDAVVKSGRLCKRWAIAGSRYCMAHDEQTRRQPKWTKEIVVQALCAWAEVHGEPPKADDWKKAADGHPSFRTVTDLFGRWNFALAEAGLRKGYRCPCCGGWTVKKSGRGRPPKCPTCQVPQSHGLKVAA